MYIYNIYIYIYIYICNMFDCYRKNIFDCCVNGKFRSKLVKTNQGNLRYTVNS